MGRRLPLVFGALVLVLALMPASHASAASRSDGALTIHLRGETTMQLERNYWVDYDGHSRGSGVLTTSSIASTMACTGFEWGEGNLFEGYMELDVRCTDGRTMVDCDNLVATRTYFTSMITYGKCVVAQGFSTWTVLVPSTVLQWVPTGSSASSTSYVLTGTLPFADV